MSTTRELKIIVELSDQTIESLIDAAGYGMRHWCRKAIVDTEKKTYQVFPDPSAVGGVVKTKHTLTYDMIRNAIVILWDAGELPRWFEEEILDGEIYGDSHVGDMIIQQAAFREQVFG